MTMYAVVYGVVISGMSYLQTIDSKRIIDYIGTLSFGWLIKDYFYYYVLICLSVALSYGAYKLYVWYINYNTTKDTKYCFEYHNTDNVASILSYLRYFPDVYDIQTDSSNATEAMEFLFRKIQSEAGRGLESNTTYAYMKELRNFFLPVTGKYIKYKDDSIGIEGQLLLNISMQNYNNVVVVGDKAKEEQKTIMLVSISFYVEKNLQDLNSYGFFRKIQERVEQYESSKHVVMYHYKMIPIKDDKKDVTIRVKDMFHYDKIATFESLGKKILFYLLEN